MSAARFVAATASHFFAPTRPFTLFQRQETMPPPVTAASVEESLDLVMANFLAQLGEIHNNIQADIYGCKRAWPSYTANHRKLLFKPFLRSRDTTDVTTHATTTKILLRPPSPKPSTPAQPARPTCHRRQPPRPTTDLTYFTNAATATKLFLSHEPAAPRPANTHNLQCCTPTTATTYKPPTSTSHRRHCR